MINPIYTYIQAKSGLKGSIQKTLQMYDFINITEEADSADVKVFVTNKQEELDYLRKEQMDSASLICTDLRSNGEVEAHKLITPLDWSASPIAERIAATLALQLTDQEIRLGKIITVSPDMKAVYQRIMNYAQYREPLLLLGETGVGKSLLAREYYNHNPKGEFVVINSAVFTSDLIASELFGHGKGAFTGADKSKPGLLRSASDGTVFMDEIGDMPLSLQPHMLLAVESGKVRPVGSASSEEIDCRFVFATNHDLEDETRFRPELLARIGTATVRLPSLRECRCDTLILAKYFLQEWCDQYSVEMALPATCHDLLFSHGWQRNTRELRNTIRAAAMSSSDGVLSFAELEHLLDQGKKAQPERYGLILNPEAGETWDEAQDKLKMEYFKRLLIKFPSKKEAAIQAEMSKARLYEICKELGL